MKTSKDVLINKSKTYLKHLSLCFILSLAVTLLIFNVSNKCYAINKPTYSDMIKGKYGDAISDKEAESLAIEESTMKEAYVKGLNTFVVTESDLTEKNGYYGKYPSGFTGAINFRRKNFVFLAYSIRDLSLAGGKQPLIAGKKNINNFNTLGFNMQSWKINGMTSENTIKWMLNQFEIKKLLRVYEDSDYIVLKDVYEGNYKDLMNKKSTLSEVVTLIGDNGISDLNEGDLLINYDTEKNKLNYVGIYLGIDEQGLPYSLSPNKMAYSAKNYARNVWALSYVNKTNVYSQNINNTINLISGTKYNYAIKLKFLKTE